MLLSPDGRYLATMRNPGDALTVWDVERQTVLVEDPGPVAGAARFSPDSRWIALRRGGGELLGYDLATGRPRRALVGADAGGLFCLSLRWGSDRAHRRRDTAYLPRSRGGNRPAHPVDSSAHKRRIGGLEPRRRHSRHAVR